jgi:large repetitive protein
MVSARHFGALIVASVVAVALIPLQALPASALGSPAPKATTADKLDPLPSDKQPKPKLDTPTGDFSNPPPAHVEQAKTHPGVSSFDPAKSKLVEQTERTSIYENPDGSRTAKISQDVQNAKDDKGVWHSIDSTVTKKSDGHLHNGFGQTDVTFGDFADDDNVANVKNGSASLGFSLVGAKGGKAAKADKDTVTYSDVIGDGTDIRYQVGSTQLKENIVLNTKPATAPTYRFKINVSKVTPSTDTDGTIVFKDKGGTVVFRIPKGVAWDSSSTELNTTHPVDITLSADNKYIDVSVDQAFLETATYPVFVDPTIDSYWLGADDHSRAYDAPVESPRHTQNFNGAG